MTPAFPLRPLCAAAVAAACVLTPSVALANKVLFLSTAEVPQVGPGGPAIMNTAFEGFRDAAGGPANIIDRRGALTNEALTTSDFDGVDVVVVQSVYNTISAANMALIQNLADTRPDLTFALFLDGCCQTASNLTPMLTFLSGKTGWTLTPATSIGSVINSPLNTASPYSSTFSAVNPLVGEAYELVPNVPAGYALYLPHGATPPATLSTTVQSYGLILPQKRMNNGAGACTMLVADTSHFTKGTHVSLATATLNAARATAGGCKGETVETDLTPVMTGPASLIQNVPQSYSVTVQNVGLTDMPAAPAATVVVELPAGMTPVPASLPANCSWSAPNITCTGLPAIAAGASAPPISFSAVTSTLTSVTLKSVVGGTVPGEINTANNQAGAGSTGAPRANVTASVMGVQAVPTLGAWALTALAGLLGLLGVRRQRKQAA